VSCRVVWLRGVRALSCSVVVRFAVICCVVLCCVVLCCVVLCCVWCVALCCVVSCAMWDVASGELRCVVLSRVRVVRCDVM